MITSTLYLIDGESSGIAMLHSYRPESVLLAGFMVSLDPSLLMTTDALSVNWWSIIWELIAITVFSFPTCFIQPSLIFFQMMGTALGKLLTKQ